MPTVFRHHSYRFFFFSNEGNPREPVHVHVKQGDATAKIWLNPMQIADSHGFRATALREIVELVDSNRERIERAWNEYFGEST